jgi:hypothetical protein
VTAKKEITGLCGSVTDSMPRRINAWNGAWGTIGPQWSRRQAQQTLLNKLKDGPCRKCAAASSKAYCQ